MDEKRIYAGEVTLEELCRMNQEGTEFVCEDGRITKIIKMAAVSQ